MRILITGGGGFLGSRLRVLLPDALAPLRSELDLTEGRAVQDYLDAAAPDVIVHAAARVGGILANLRQPADFLVDNLRMDANLLAAARRSRPAHLVAVLSTCMYPDALPANAYPMDETQIEDGPPPPTNAAYAAAKRALWHGARELHNQYGVGYTAIIPANLYGPGDHFGSEGSHFLAAALDRTERARLEDAAQVEHLGTGRARRQFVHVDDVAGLVAHLVETGPLNDAVNVAPTGDLSIRELALAVAEAVGFPGDVVFSGEGPDGQIRKEVDTARLRRLVPEWSAIERPLSRGLKDTVDWYREHVETR